MPYTKRQKGLMGADLARKRAGKRTRTGMTEAQLVEGVKSPAKRKKPARKRT